MQQRNLLKVECDRCLLFYVVLQLLDHVVRYDHDMLFGGRATQALDVLQANAALSIGCLAVAPDHCQVHVGAVSGTCNRWSHSV